ncbi:MAG: DNA mismatch endonuclease Vsr [Gammaproteobacteria bacterium]|nr:DNA mismatch endonuclease Vsr [Gammaproteobacteria bacterium]
MADNLSPEARSRCMSRIRSRDMKPELAVRSMVHSLGFRFRLHRKGMPGRPDLVLPRHRKVIFVHGCFWHWHPEPNCPIAGLPKSNLSYWRPKLARTRVRDQRNITALTSTGWRVLTVWECQLRQPGAVLFELCRFLDE